MKTKKDFIAVIVVFVLVVLLGVGLVLCAEQNARIQGRDLGKSFIEYKIQKKCLDGYVYYVVIDAYGVELVRSQSGSGVSMPCPITDNFIFHRGN